jgi:hypothetical protein
MTLSDTLRKTGGMQARAIPCLRLTRRLCGLNACRSYDAAPHCYTLPDQRSGTVSPSQAG